MAGRNWTEQELYELQQGGRIRVLSRQHPELAPNDLHAHRRQHAGDAPGTPGGEGAEKRSPQPIQRPEQALQIQQVEFLTWALIPPWRFLHIPNGGFRTPAEAAIMKAMGQQAGAADILFLGPAGAFVWIENKSQIGRLSDAQKEWRDWCASIGAPWFLCRSLEDLIAACQDAGVPLKGKPQ